MAKCDLNGIEVEEINRNSKNAYAANIVSGEIHSVVCRHSKNGNILLQVEGKALTCKDFGGGTFVSEGCILYNQPLTRCIVEACDDSNDSIYIINGAVSKTAPASKPSSDNVVPKTDLLKEKEEIQKNYFSLKGAKKAEADARLAAIETQLKNA